jgi:hypothetical protein
MLSVDSWLWLLGIALGVWLVVTFVNLAFLYKRSRELRNSFRDGYPS